MSTLVQNARFRVGDCVPPFSTATSLGYDVQLHSAGGRYLILAFAGPPSVPAARLMLDDVAGLVALIDPEACGVAAVVSNAPDPPLDRAAETLLLFYDPEDKISTAYGALSPAPNGQQILWPHLLILDPNMRVLGVLPLRPDMSCRPATMAFLESLPRPALHTGIACPAPVLIAPRVFEIELCRHLVREFDDTSSNESGFMIERNGVTVGEVNHAIKRRRDMLVADPALRELLARCIRERLVPDMAKAFQFRPTRMDRHIVARYDAASGGYFRPHRDNTSKGTAHRRFAVTINLNPDEYEGADLRFPEFGDMPYRAPAGAAIAFSCSLLHEVTPIIRGRRFAFLAFLYGEEDAALRQRNNAHLGANEHHYVDGEDRL
jgi:hypothetical protein